MYALHYLVYNPCCCMHCATSTCNRVYGTFPHTEHGGCRSPELTTWRLQSYNLRLSMNPLCLSPSPTTGAVTGLRLLNTQKQGSKKNESLPRSVKVPLRRNGYWCCFPIEGVMISCYYLYEQIRHLPVFSTSNYIHQGEQIVKT